ncbi:MAG: ABC transporter permease subunit, partial [Caldilineaceae bacterium]|nr:ABC transporter permease subunit [Caldilineaceae bacterium]
LWSGLIHEATPILLYSPLAVVVVLVYVWIPFAALPIFAALQRIDNSLLEAAADLGSPQWETFLRVVLPLSMPGVGAAFFLVFIPTLGEYVTPLLVGGVNGIMYGNVIQSQFSRALNWPLGSLLSLVMLVVVLPIMLLFNRLIKLEEIVEI